MLSLNIYMSCNIIYNFFSIESGGHPYPKPFWKEMEFPMENNSQVRIYMKILAKTIGRNIDDRVIYYKISNQDN